MKDRSAARPWPGTLILKPAMEGSPCPMVSAQLTLFIPNIFRSISPMESSACLSLRYSCRRSRYPFHGESRDISLSRTRVSCGVCYRFPDRLSIGQKQRQQHPHATRRGAHMTIACPRCNTAFLVPRRRAQTMAAALGGVAGAIRGVSTVLADTEAHASRHPLGIMAGAILGALLGGAAGCAAGSAIGAPIDQTLSNNLRCQVCSHVVDANRVDPSLTRRRSG